jgi:hypothetical protein
MIEGQECTGKHSDVQNRQNKLSESNTAPGSIPLAALPQSTVLYLKPKIDRLGVVCYPPLDVLFADGLTAEEADALQGVDGGTPTGGLHPESSDPFHSAISDEFYDVYSDAYFDTGTP